MNVSKPNTAETRSSNAQTSTTTTSIPPAEKTTSVSTTFPVLQSGRDVKASIISLDSWTRLVLTLDGRDKITKILQYAARFLAWYWQGVTTTTSSSLSASSNAGDVSAGFRALQSSLATSRKAYRLGRSLVEYQKLRTMGLFQKLLKYLQNCDNDNKKAEAVSLFTTVIGPAVKTIGLLLFWLGDNINYVVGTGCLPLHDDDDSNIGTSRRLRIQERAAIFANRSYFVSSVAGLLVNYHAYCCCSRQQASRIANNKEEEDGEEETKKQGELDRAKQFALAVALVKSCCDVVVFSNNPGLDFWKKYYGKKLHEGLHCSLGIISALTVIYNAFPNAEP